MIKLFELTGQYEVEVTKHFDRLARNAKLVVDVGGFNGYFTDRALRAGARHVDVYEPNLVKQKKLDKKYLKNNRVLVLHYAVMDRVGITQFNMATKAELSSLIFLNQYYGQKTSVQTMTLDYSYPHETIDLLKIDAEGAEPLILLGALHMLNEGRIKSMIMEYRKEAWTKEAWKYVISYFPKQICLDGKNERPFGIVRNPFQIQNWIFEK